MKYALVLFSSAVLAIPALALGAGTDKLSQSDFSACNQQAMATAGVSGSSSPSASPPTMSGSSGSGTISPGTTTGSSGTTRSGAGTGAAPTGSAGSSGAGSTVGGSGRGTTGSTGMSSTSDDGRLDMIVQAYRSCLKSRM
jgi:hypothetical protein